MSAEAALAVFFVIFAVGLIIGGVWALAGAMLAIGVLSFLAQR